MMRLFHLKLTILDDCTFTKEQMEAYVQEAIELHVEALKVQVDEIECHEVIASLVEMADA